MTSRQNQPDHEHGKNAHEYFKERTKATNPSQPGHKKPAEDKSRAGAARPIIHQPEPQSDELGEIIAIYYGLPDGNPPLRQRLEAWGRKQQEIVLDRANASLNGALYAGLGRKKTIAELRKEQG